jgi:hypothetical protein
MKIRALLAILIFAAVCQSARGFDLITSRGSSTGGNVVLARQFPTDLLSVPVGGLGDRQWRIETGFARTFDLKDLDQGLIAAAARKGRFGFSIGASQFGQRDSYTEQTAKGALMYCRGSLTGGVTASYYRVSFGGIYAPLASTGVGAALAWRHTHVVVAISGDNLNKPTLYRESVPFQPKYVAQVECISNPQFSTLGKVTLQESERPQFGLGQRIGIGPRHAVLWGISTAPLVYGGGLELWFSRMSVCYAATYHPVLGLSQTLTISVGSLLFAKERRTGVLDR